MPHFPASAFKRLLIVPVERKPHQSQAETHDKVREQQKLQRKCDDPFCKLCYGLPR